MKSIYMNRQDLSAFPRKIVDEENGRAWTAENKGGYWVVYYWEHFSANGGYWHTYDSRGERWTIEEVNQTFPV